MGESNPSGAQAGPLVAYKAITSTVTRAALLAYVGEQAKKNARVIRISEKIAPRRRGSLFSNEIVVVFMRTNPIPDIGIAINNIDRAISEGDRYSTRLLAVPALIGVN